MSVTILTGPSCFYFAFDRMYIIADHPDAPEQMKQCPDMPAVNQVALELITEMTHAKATAEGKVALLKKAIEAL
jgi:hypothetical protein